MDHHYWARDRQIEACAALGDEAFLRPIGGSFASLRGQRATYPLWRLMTQLVAHQNYHRGQVSTLLRMSGAEPPTVDFLVGRDADFR